VEIVFKMILGVIGGALVGFVLSRARSCSSTACNTRANAVFSVIAGAAFGAALMWHFVRGH